LYSIENQESKIDDKSTKIEMNIAKIRVDHVSWCNENKSCCVVRWLGGFWPREILCMKDDVEIIDGKKRVRC